MITSTIRKITDWINGASSIFILLSGILTVLMSFVATYGVVRRYVFNKPEPYSYELSMILLLWTFVLGISYVEREDSQLRVDFFQALMPEKIGFFISMILSRLIGLFFGVVLTWKGWQLAMYSLRVSEKSTSIWSVPLFPVKILVPIGYGLLSLVLLVKLIYLIPGINGTKENPEKPGHSPDKLEV
ncbi:MAG: TRAP transporter small permease [Deltaproteobacteria bacterium]|nr:TRAP transporter small permease [Deltaproteobacteria bacterium]